jgi:hypothetical protein
MMGCVLRWLSAVRTRFRRRRDLLLEFIDPPQIAKQVEGRRRSIRASLLGTLGEGSNFFRWLGFYRKANERKFARIVSLEILGLYVSQRIANPDLHGRPLYEKITSKYLNVTDAEARDVVQRAEQSFAIWPTEREVRLKDVAHYIVVNEYIETNGVRGVESHFKKVIDKVISDHL